jgi:hypothetical protein
MRHIKSVPQFVAALALICLLFPRQAHAYLDPGTGSYVLQILIAGLIGLSFALKMYYRNLKAFLGNLFSRWRKSEERHD